MRQLVDAGFDPEGDWDMRAYQVTKADKAYARTQDGTGEMLLAYKADWHIAAKLCNVSRQTGAVCRLWREHDGPHVPFAGELVATTGVYVLERIK